MRRFEFVQGTSSKFWMGDVEGTNFVVVFGRIGTAGQRKDKAFPTEDAARRELEKKIAEKVREGYAEVGGAAAPTAAATPPKQVAPALPPLPPRLRTVPATPQALATAANALAALQASLGQRSFMVHRHARRALAALDAIAGHDPAAPLRNALDALVAAVTAPAGKPRLPLRLALQLLAKLDIAAFARATQQLGAASARAPVPGLAQLLHLTKTIPDPELSLRVGQLLVERTWHGGNQISWDRRWRGLQAHLEAALAGTGSTLASYLHDLEALGDPHLTLPIARMGQRAA